MRTCPPLSSTQAYVLSGSSHLARGGGNLVSLQLKAHVGSDETLSLQVPTDFRETDVEILLVLNPVPEASSSPVLDSEWPAGFFEATFGSCQDEPLVRLPQGK